MSIGSTTDNQGTSTRPYLLRALHDWCTDNGFTPYIAVYVDDSVQVPREHVKNNEIVLNVGFEATSGLKLGNEVVEFRARFGGVSRDIVVPVDHVVAIYARENGQGMAFPVPTPETSRPTVAASAGSAEPVPPAAAGGAHPRGLRLAGGADLEAEARASAKPAEAAGAELTAAAPSAADDQAGAAPVHPSGDDSNGSPDHSPDNSPKGPRPTLKRIK